MALIFDVICQQLLCLALIFLITFTSCTSCRPFDHQETSIMKKYEQWITEHNRVYKDQIEKAMRFEIFKENVEAIESFNKLNQGFKLGLNTFSDLTNEEFRASHLGSKNSFNKHFVMNGNKLEHYNSFIYENAMDVPSSMDWRLNGAVTPIKYQGNCGSCWAFSAVASMEGIIKIKTNNLVSLSEQELLDCDTKGQNKGCNGGLPENAYQFIIHNQGLTTESNYPYIGVQRPTCNNPTTAAKISGYEQVPTNNETALLLAVANQPISIGLDASGIFFQHYRGGIFRGMFMCSQQLNHAVTIVGYGTDVDGTKYWILKNSWGKSWGENGFMRIARDVDQVGGMCGLAMMASYPVA